MWNLFSSSNTGTTNIGLAGDVSGFTTEGLSGLALTSTILAYNVKNFNLNSENLDVNKKTLAINEHLLSLADEHLDIDLLRDISSAINSLNEKMDKHNEILERLISDKL